MARLTIEQVKAPDFSASSEMLARANESFNSGMESAKGILGKYDEGQKFKNDNLLLNDIAKLDSEQALKEFLASDRLQGLNISDGMRDTVMGLRSDVLGYAQNRAATDSTLAATSRANAVEGRAASEYLDMTSARTERRGLTGAVVDNAVEGRRYGLDGPSGGSSGVSADNPVFSSFMGTIQEAGVTNPYALAAIAATGSHESGFSESNATGSWSDPSESGRPGTAGGVMSWNNDRFENMRRFTNGNLSGSAQAQYFLQEDPALIEALQNAGSAAEATALMNNAWRFAGYDRPGGEAARRMETAESLVPMFNGGQNMPITENAQGGPANDALRSAIGNPLYLEPDQALALLETGYAAQREGQALIDTAEAKRQSEVVAGAQIANLQNPDIITGAGLQSASLNIPGISNANRLAAGTAAGELATTFAGVLAPSLTPDTQVNDALARTAATNTAAAGNDPLARSFALAKTFDNAEGGAGTALLSGFDVPEGSGLTSAYVDRRLQAMADDADVSKGQMAVTISSVAQGNYEQFDRMLNAAPDEEIYANTMSIADRDFGAEAQATLETQRGEQSRREADRASAELQLSTARIRAAKADVGSDARRKADAEVASLRDTILKGMTPQEREQNLVDYVSKTSSGSLLSSIQSDMARYPEGTPRGDAARADFFRAMADLEQEVERDDSLTDNEKELLLRDIRG